MTLFPPGGSSSVMEIMTSGCPWLVPESTFGLESFGVLCSVHRQAFENHFFEVCGCVLRHGKILDGLAGLRSVAEMRKDSGEDDCKSLPSRRDPCSSRVRPHKAACCGRHAMPLFLCFICFLVLSTTIHIVKCCEVAVSA